MLEAIEFLVVLLAIAVTIGLWMLVALNLIWPALLLGLFGTAVIAVFTTFVIRRTHVM